MEKIMNIGIVILISAFFLNCKSTKDLSKTNEPFEVVNATYKNWVGGQPGVNGVIVEIEIDNSAIKLDSMYFRNMKVRVERIQNTSKEKYIGHFTYPNSKNNIILHGDPKKEFGNEVPDISNKIPFDLKKDEAVVSYFFNQKESYFKVMDIKEISE